MDGESISDQDTATIAAMSGVIGAFRNTTHWYNNASFLLPLVATLLVGALGALRRSPDLLGFAAFLGVVTVAMLPVVLAGWRQTATTVVVTERTIVILHHGRALKSLDWRKVTSVRQRETQGNIRWEIAADDGDRLFLDGELENLPRLVQLARQQAGLVG